MDISSRTAWIVGGTSGIGLGLARRLVAEGGTVIVGGRDTSKVAALAAAHPDDADLARIETVEIDVADPASIARARDEVLTAHPDLDLVVTMSGVMLIEDLRDPAHVDAAEATVAVNLLGTIRVIDAVTPHLLARGAGDIVTVSSGIAFLPFPLMPTYAATKAGVHAYSEALRAQLAGTGVNVTELVPPSVATVPEALELNPAALPLDDYLDETLALLASEPTPREILVQKVQMHRWAERDGSYDELVAARSAALASLPGR
ncbi:SDR family oxidoreductase [Schumannella soli]|uniref:SDR family NAD(P)-dependent oxidoreductase n=1 Tax=Schumannella soli TaxID=2590779 RepID=A0A506XNL6_9MICO|nr:SDR family NAD(P)-dependent oxidoreductase [Schumannella soli]TPW74191.1 SDR family NAD(P)-dependent oxidoreductase [Schumannella soli]